MTKITANIILLMMATTWTLISIETRTIQPVSDQFMWLAVALASGEGLGLLTQRFNLGGTSK